MSSHSHISFSYPTIATPSISFMHCYNPDFKLNSLKKEIGLLSLLLHSFSNSFRFFFFSISHTHTRTHFFIYMTMILCPCPKKSRVTEKKKKINSHPLLQSLCISISVRFTTVELEEKKRKKNAIMIQFHISNYKKMSVNQ